MPNNGMQPTRKKPHAADAGRSASRSSVVCRARLLTDNVQTIYGRIFTCLF